MRPAAVRGRGVEVLDVPSPELVASQVPAAPLATSICGSAVHLVDGPIEAAAPVTVAVPLDGAPGAFEELRHPDRDVRLVVRPG